MKTNLREWLIMYQYVRPKVHFALEFSFNNKAHECESHNIAFDLIGVCYARLENDGSIGKKADVCIYSTTVHCSLFTFT